MNIEPFTPPFFLKNAHVQTLGSHFLSIHKNPPSQTHYVPLEDGDEMALEISIPQHELSTTPLVLLMPGTSGSHLSPYLRRIASKLLKKGYRVARLNFRGVATALGRAKKVSHAGSSEDVFQAILWLKEKFPNTPLFAAGFSLSGNTLLKCAAEKDLRPYLEKIFSLCPPLDLSKSSQRLELKANRVYQNSIVQTILKIVKHKNSQFTFPEKFLEIPIITLREFDDSFTAPTWGFNDAIDYYNQSSSLPLIDQVSVKTHLLFAQDDPLIDSSEIVKKTLPKHIDLTMTQYGGHLGYLSHSLPKMFWMDNWLIHHIQNH